MVNIARAAPENTAQPAIQSSRFGGFAQGGHVKPDISTATLVAPSAVTTQQNPGRLGFRQGIRGRLGQGSRGGLGQASNGTLSQRKRGNLGKGGAKGRGSRGGLGQGSKGGLGLGIRDNLGKGGVKGQGNIDSLGQGKSVKEMIRAKFIKFGMVGPSRRAKKLKSRVRKGGKFASIGKKVQAKRTKGTGIKGRTLTAPALAPVSNTTATAKTPVRAIVKTPVTAKTAGTPIKTLSGQRRAIGTSSGVSQDGQLASSIQTKKIESDANLSESDSESSEGGGSARIHRG